MDDVKFMHNNVKAEYLRWRSLIGPTDPYLAKDRLIYAFGCAEMAA